MEHIDPFYLNEVMAKLNEWRGVVAGIPALTPDLFRSKWQDQLFAFLRACRLAEMSDMVQIAEQLRLQSYDQVARYFSQLDDNLFIPLASVLDIYKSQTPAAAQPVMSRILETLSIPAEDSPVQIERVPVPEPQPRPHHLDSLTAIFVDEALGIITGLANDLIEFENNPENLEIVNRMFRAAHTLKGNAATLGLEEIKVISHKIESFFDLFRKEQLKPELYAIDLLTESTAVLDALVRRFGEGAELRSVYEPFLAKIENFGQNKPQPEKGTEKEKEKDHTQKLMLTSLKQNIERENQTLRIDAHKLDTIVSQAGEVNILNNNISKEYRDLLSLARQAKLIHDEQLDDMLNNLDVFTNMINSLQNSIVRARMIPFHGIFKKYPSLIRSLARQVGKEIQIEFIGEKLEIDKTIYEEIADPIMHLIRNAVDHGIEKPEERVRLGKNKKGTIRIEAKIDGCQIKLFIEDDGQGINKKLVLEKAIKKGLVKAEKSAVMTEKEIYNLIFLPGFSTRDDATDISGRGVGMDVVRQNILNLNGMIQVESRDGIGTRISLILPTSLTIREVLIVGKDIHAIGISVEYIVEVLDIYPSNIIIIENKEFLEYENKLIPFIYMRNIFGIKSIGKDKVFKTVILKAANDLFAVCVDSIERRQQVMIKPLNELIKKIENINEVSLMGDGSILLLLDVGQALRKLDQISVPVLKDYRGISRPKNELFVDFEEQSLLNPAGMAEYILFSINTEEDSHASRRLLAIEVSKVAHIMDLSVLVDLPEQPRQLAGFIHHQGCALPLYDLPSLLGGTRHDASKVILVNDREGQVGLLCHKVHKLIRHKPEEVSAFSDSMIAFRHDFVSGIIFHPNYDEIVVIDPEKLFQKNPLPEVRVPVLPE